MKGATKVIVENAGPRRVGEARGRYRFADIIGTSRALHAALELVERAVPTNSTVLITGETGTGKELVARAIHYNGPRADKPFVSENFGAIATDVQASELFGHRRGAFTGAIEDRDGLFAVADKGTLFLDEIGDCPPDLQTRLLRVLDQKEIRRVGDSKPVRVDVRIIAATHHDLENEVERAFALADADTYITPDLLSARFGEERPPVADAGDGSTLRAAVERFEARLLRDALLRHGGNQTRAADELGVSRRALIDKLQKYGLPGRRSGGE